ncbi:hypothetical protein [Curtobacterium sp. MCPF17_031]|uniref:hypothetical protein n=1 Tax=Curtobacterium sp. MCPF17_031 TaxID=2175653 RepID=UPI000DAA852E|nr:hypothetical protein [Curtobacterium sp. MCPF17_031]PZE37120.1 hypothetical protein DEJ31_08350 [Curtobacterium sp. MCPF17_031]
MTGIDRHALVTRHDVHLTEARPDHVLTVGNGDFAYTCDITGMQTFTTFHDPLAAMTRATAAGDPGAASRGPTVINTATMSNWGWHEMPNPNGFVLDDALSEHTTSRGTVRYADKFDMQAAMQGTLPADHLAGAWLNANPQRIDLGRIGLLLRETMDSPWLDDPTGLQDPSQRLDLWTGTITSTFEFAGEPVTVTTVASPSTATVAFRVESALINAGLLRVGVRFPYPSDGFFHTDDWAHPDRHLTDVLPSDTGRTRLRREIDGTTYDVLLDHGSAGLTAAAEPHTFELSSYAQRIEIVATFSPDAADEPADERVPFSVVAADSAEHWAEFWQSGAAIDFTGSTDARADELERRVVLSQYLTAVHAAGTLPPQETGLVTNSWQGKFHLEMHLWHAAHFATWGRPELLARSLPWYLSIADSARETARMQGYEGLRWPKQVGPDGRESPDPTGSLLIWQQPHLLYLLELLWTSSAGDRHAELLDDFTQVVDDTAAFMASFVEERDGVFHLPAPLMPAQEFYETATTEDPTFELAYWWWGLELAQRWQERSGRPRRGDWADVQARLAMPGILGEHYAAIATDPHLRRDDHPSLLAALGLLPPTPIIDQDLMAATLTSVWEAWDWSSAWGWDFPVMAMTAARIGRLDLAVDALLRDEAKNTYSAVGHNAQIGSILPVYLPGNGSLLAAVSLMASTGSFPKEGWMVQAEGFLPWP